MVGGADGMSHRGARATLFATLPLPPADSHALFSVWGSGVSSLEVRHPWEGGERGLQGEGVQAGCHSDTLSSAGFRGGRFCGGPKQKPVSKGWCTQSVPAAQCRGFPDPIPNLQFKCSRASFQWRFAFYLCIAGGVRGHQVRCIRTCTCTVCRQQRCPPLSFVC